MRLYASSFLRWAPTSMVATLLGGCALFATENLTPEQKALLAQDVRDGLMALRPFIGDRAEPFVAAVEPMLVAFATGEPFDFGAAFASLRPLEPMLHQALIDAGRTVEEADALLAVVKIALRRIEFALAATPAAEVPS